MIPLEVIPEVDIYFYWIAHVLVVTAARPCRAKGFHDGSLVMVLLLPDRFQCLMDLSRAADL